MWPSKYSYFGPGCSHVLTPVSAHINQAELAVLHQHLPAWGLISYCCRIQSFCDGRPWSGRPLLYVGGVCVFSSVFCTHELDCFAVWCLGLSGSLRAMYDAFKGPERGIWSKELAQKPAMCRRIKRLSSLPPHGFGVLVRFGEVSHFKTEHCLGFARKVECF